MVRLEDVIGTAKVVYWPLDRVGSVRERRRAGAPCRAPAGQGRR